MTTAAQYFRAVCGRMSSAFGSQAEGFLRLSYANSLDNLAEAMRRLRRYVEEKKQE